MVTDCGGAYDGAVGIGEGEGGGSPDVSVGGSCAAVMEESGNVIDSSGHGHGEVEGSSEEAPAVDTEPIVGSVRCGVSSVASDGTPICVATKIGTGGGKENGASESRVAVAGADCRVLVGEFEDVVVPCGEGSAGGLEVDGEAHGGSGAGEGRKSAD